MQSDPDPDEENEQATTRAVAATNNAAAIAMSAVSSQTESGENGGWGRGGVGLSVSRYKSPDLIYTPTPQTSSFPFRFYLPSLVRVRFLFLTVFAAELLLLGSFLQRYWPSYVGFSLRIRFSFVSFSFFSLFLSVPLSDVPLDLQTITATAVY